MRHGHEIVTSGKGFFASTAMFSVDVSLGATLGATKGGKMAPFFCKRHQTRHLDFPSHPLLTEMLEVRIFPREPILLFPVSWIFSERKFSATNIRWHTEGSTFFGRSEVSAIVFEFKDMRDISF
jgi:hypothetical protein